MKYLVAETAFILTMSMNRTSNTSSRLLLATTAVTPDPLADRLDRRRGEEVALDVDPVPLPLRNAAQDGVPRRRHGEHDDYDGDEEGGDPDPDHGARRQSEQQHARRIFCGIKRYQALDSVLFVKKKKKKQRKQK